MAAATCTTLECNPKISSSSAYCGSSVVYKDASSSHQPCSSRLPWNMSHACRALLAPSELTATVPHTPAVTGQTTATADQARVRYQRSVRERGNA